MPDSTSASTIDPSQAGPPCFLVCSQCSTRVAHTSQIVSRAYRGHAGKAALFTTVKNVILDPPSILLMDSGAYTIQEFICKSCETYLGWKFYRAHDGPERWKEGHFVLELDLVQEQDGTQAQSGEGLSSPLDRIEEEPQSHPPMQKRSPSAPPPSPPKGAQQGVRSYQTASKRPHVPRKLELDDYDDGGPFWKPR
ncbi:yippee-domain-containing protein [Trametes coccinea BRFM310]|uniref:Yippee-domain-containing protein n=1 Tax=Trametes coccinea (strain BRFM310) TaxID=1353009 RepID=A0A1Y2IN71_TRAC3|nr:yippee-domain-containing protein [Trametes coccinea BRFM310]